MASRFLERAEKELLRKIAIISGEIRDPRLDGLYSLSRVSLAPDFSQVKCYFSINGTPWKIEEMLDALKKAAPFIRKRLAQSVKFKKIPQIYVYYDSSPDAIAEMNLLFKKIESESAEDESHTDTCEGSSSEVPADGDVLDEVEDHDEAQEHDDADVDDEAQVRDEAEVPEDKQNDDYQ